MNASIPAQCTNPQCAKVFPSFISIPGPNSFFHIHGNTQSCPFCGGLAEIANIVGGPDEVGRSNVFPLDESSQRMFSTLRQIAEAASSGKISREEAVVQASAISKPAAKTIQWAIDTNQLSLLIAILTLFYTIWHDHNNDYEDKVFKNRVLQEISRQSFEVSKASEAINKISYVTKNYEHKKFKNKNVESFKKISDNQKKFNKMNRKQRRKKISELRNSSKK